MHSKQREDHPQVIAGVHAWRAQPVAAATALFAAVALSLGASGCGGSSASGVASLGSTTTTATTNGSVPSQQQALLAFSRCMRAHGAGGFPDPQQNPDGSYGYGNLTEIRKLIRASKQASQTCQSDLEGAGILTQQNLTNFRAQMLAFARCMRSHGEPSFPDPNANGRFGGQLKTFDRTSAAFENAMKACRSKLTAAEDAFAGGSGQ